MRRRVARIIVNLTVELTAGGQTIRAVSQDVTPFGMFIRMATPLPVGSVVELAMSPGGTRFTTTATVVHSLAEPEARMLGRKPGIGIVFRDTLRDQADLEFQGELIRLIETNPQIDPVDDELVIVVADQETRLLERLSTALGNAGFLVHTATNGLEALGAALSRNPDVVLAERDMPVMDGMRLLEEMGRQPELAAIPFIMMSENATDLVRLQALQLGAIEYLPKPFTALEVVLRARRLGRLGRREGERVLLRGAVEQLGLPSLLTMLEQERKTGVLRLTRDETVAWLSFVDGRLVRARASDKRDDSRSTVMRILDWTAGHFELSAGAAEGDPELDDSVTHLLLEHARVTDEARARS
jgi:DNA-binding response OmpR family regulator